MFRLSKFYVFLVTIILSLFIFSKDVEARIELTFTSPPSIIESTDSFTIDVTLSGAESTAEYYVRGVFYKPDTSQYFGFTQNIDGNWNNDSSNFSQFYKITGNGTHQITFKPDNSSSYFSSGTNYLFKVGRYTTGGSLSWSDQTPAVILFNSSEITPTISPELTSTPIVSTTPPPSITITPQITPTQNPVDPNSIKLSEIMACPPTTQSEWVEIFNSGGSEITLQNWKLRDSTDTHTIEINNTIQPFNYLVIPIPTAILNNSGDSVRLYTDQDQLVDQMSYSSCQNNTSYIFVNNSWQPTQNVTQGTANVFTSLPTTTPTVSKSSEVEKNLSDDNVPEITQESKSSDNETELAEFYDDDSNIKLPDVASSEAEPTLVSESTTIDASTSDSNVSFSNDASLFSTSSAYLIGGCSFVLSAAFLAQQWYNLMFTI